MATKKYIISESKLRTLIKEAIMETLACLGGEYNKRFRHLCHDVKAGDIEAIDTASIILSKYVPPRSVLIPIPSHTGESTYTLKLAKFIAKRSNAKVLNILSSQPREKMYNLKMNGSDINKINLGFNVSPDNDGQIAQILSNARNIILIDNVVSSGVTYEQAQKVIKEKYGVDAWMLSLGAIEKSPYDKGEKRVIRSTFPDKY